MVHLDDKDASSWSNLPKPFQIQFILGIMLLKYISCIYTSGAYYCVTEHKRGHYFNEIKMLKFAGINWCHYQNIKTSANWQNIYKNYEGLQSSLWWVVLKKIFKYVSYNFTFSILSPLGKGFGPSFGHTWIPSSQWCFVLSLVEIGPVVLEKIKMWTVYRETDAGQNGIRTFGQRWAKMQQKFFRK